MWSQKHEWHNLTSDTTTTGIDDNDGDNHYYNNDNTNDTNKEHNTCLPFLWYTLCSSSINTDVHNMAFVLETHL